MSDKSTKKDSRRDFILKSLTAASSLGFRSFLLGLPTAFLTKRAMANPNATYLIYSTYAEGCPLNANVPGAYVSGVTHPASFATPVSFSLGPAQVQAAGAWATLPQALRDRLQFIHHHTLTNAHSEAENVMRVQGSLKTATGSGQEMLPSAVAQINKAALGTMSTAPIVLGQLNASVTFNSVAQPYIAPTALRSLFPATISATTRSLQQFRDNAIDSLYQDLKTNGTSAQKKFLDDHVNSAAQSRQLALEFQSTLNNLGTGYVAELRAAAALIAAKVTPTIVVGLRFGSDNHSQSGEEVNQTEVSIAAMTDLWSQLNALGIADKTTFCIQNVFGRTLRGGPTGGRQHHGAHSVAVLFGPNVKPGVTGALDMNVGQGESTAINSTTGLAAGADVPKTETLAATAKTILKACGADEAVINQRVTLGKILRSAVV